MSGSTRFKDELRAHNRRLNHACRAKLGIGIVTWRSIKYVFQIAVLGLTLYLLEYQAVRPIFAMTFAALLISGPDILEYILVREDYVEYEELQNREGD